MIASPGVGQRLCIIAMLVMISCGNPGKRAISDTSTTNPGTSPTPSETSPTSPDTTSTNLDTTSTESDSSRATTDSGNNEETDTSSAELSGSWTFGDDTVTVTISENADGLRTYNLTSTHPMRDQGPSQRTFSEQDGDPLLRSGILLTDALFAMAVEEARQNAVSQVSDGSFDGVVDCECYQTGELWTWVWTRDIAYATELGLAWLDPDRAAASLLFKLSELKTGGQLQIVQDTGTGGSWPISTDRVTWARGAMAVLRVVEHPARVLEAVDSKNYKLHYVGETEPVVCPLPPGSFRPLPAAASIWYWLYSATSLRLSLMVRMN